MTMFKSLFNFFTRSKRVGENGNSFEERQSNEQIFKSVKKWTNRPVSKELTIDIIDAAADDELLQTIFDNLIEKFPKDYHKEYQTVLSFSKPRQVIYILWCLEAEVKNGGFNQYYYNPSGQYAELTPEALKLVGAYRFAELVTKANKLFIAENEKITKHQDGTLEGFSKSYSDNPLDDIDTEFYEIDKIEDLKKLQIDFVRKNKSEFVDM